jgi:hypothetical protein
MTSAMATQVLCRTGPEIEAQRSVFEQQIEFNSTTHCDANFMSFHPNGSDSVAYEFHGFSPLPIPVDRG